MREGGSQPVLAEWHTELFSHTSKHMRAREKKSDINSLKELIKWRSHIIKWQEVLVAICMSYDLAGSTCFVRLANIYKVNYDLGDVKRIN